MRYAQVKTTLALYAKAQLPGLDAWRQSRTSVEFGNLCDFWNTPVKRFGGQRRDLSLAANGPCNLRIIKG